MNRRPASDIRIAFHLAWLVLAASMLLWSGRLHSSDGFAMYAVNDSLVRYGRYDIEQLHWMDIQQGTYGRDGLLYSRKGIGTSMAGFPLTVLGFMLPGLGPVQTTLLLSPLLTALGACLLYLAARRAFPHMPRTAAWLATVAWALGSVAWPYTKTFFSEPLVALATIGAFERLLALRSTPHSRRAAFGIGAWVGVGIVARSAHAIVAPFFAIAALLITWPRDIHEAWLANLGFEPYALPTFFQMRYAQIPNMVQLGLHAPLDVAWMPTTQVHLPTLLAALVVAGLAFTTAAATLGRPWRHVAGMGVLVILATWGLLWQAHVAQSPTYAAIADIIEQMPASRLRIWQDGPPGTELFLNHYRGRAPILGTNVASQELPALEATRVFEQADEPRALWIVSDGPSRLANALDQVASTRKAFVDEVVFDDLRATFYFDSATWQTTPLDTPLALDGSPLLHLQTVAVTPAPDMGFVGVRLTWRVIAPPGEPVQTFVHLFNEQGEKVAQHDGAAQNGWRSGETWQPGEILTDTHAVRVESLPPGTYTVVVGFYRLRDIAPLTTPDGAGSLTAGTITITP